MDRWAGTQGNRRLDNTPSKMNGLIKRSNNMKTKTVHIEDLRVGDTILHENKLKTLSRASFSYDEFMGRRVDGDSYRLGHKPVKLITKL